MLARDEQHVAKTLRPKMPRLGLDLVDRERDAQDRIVAREAAILADIDALVGEIERREKPHRAAKILARQLSASRPLLCPPKSIPTKTPI
jgi:hypothetical protein